MFFFTLCFVRDWLLSARKLGAEEQAREALPLLPQGLFIARLAQNSWIELSSWSCFEGWWYLLRVVTWEEPLEWGGLHCSWNWSMSEYAPSYYFFMHKFYWVASKFDQENLCSPTTLLCLCTDSGCWKYPAIFGNATLSRCSKRCTDAAVQQFVCHNYNVAFCEEANDLW